VEEQEHQVVECRSGPCQLNLFTEWDTKQGMEALEGWEKIVNFQLCSLLRSKLLLEWCNSTAYMPQWVCCLYSMHWAPSPITLKINNSLIFIYYH